MPNAELQDELVWVRSLASTAMVDPKGETERLESIVALNFRIWKLAKALAALAGVGSITRIKLNLEPFKLALVKTELEGRVDRWLLSRV